MSHEFITAAHDAMPDIIELRRTLHRRPEVGNDLPQTRETVVAALEGLPLEIHLHTTTSGIAAVLNGAGDGPTVILRGDMDGLPLTEDTGLEFASETGDTMHACGHDLHTSMLVGAARQLSSMQDRINGQVVFMFQPGEEGYAGARYMLDEGLLDITDPAPSSAFAIHVSTSYPSGEVHIRPGPQMASADEVEIVVNGRGGHASSPHLALDPISIAAEILLGVQLAITRRINVFDPAVVTFGKLSAGTANNIIPSTAHLIGTVRALSEETREQVFELLKRVATNIAAAHGATADLDFKWGYPISVNDSDIVASVEDLAGRLLGADAVVRMRTPMMGAEDWSYVMQKVPGAMAFLGACPPEIEAGVGPGNHSNLVVFDEGAMPKGIALYTGFVMDRLG